MKKINTSKLQTIVKEELSSILKEQGSVQSANMALYWDLLVGLAQPGTPDTAKLQEFLAAVVSSAVKDPDMQDNVIQLSWDRVPDQVHANIHAPNIVKIFPIKLDVEYITADSDGGPSDMNNEIVTLTLQDVQQCISGYHRMSKFQTFRRDAARATAKYVLSKKINDRALYKVDYWKILSR